VEEGHAHHFASDLELHKDHIEGEHKRMSDFRKAIDCVIAVHEGGFQNRPDDPGNWTPDGQRKGTKFGISAHAFPNEDIESMTLNRAEELYREVWGCFGAIDDQRVLTKVLDLAVNMQWAGRGPATEILQQAVAQFGTNIAIDGVFGQHTADGANGVVRDCGADELLRVICDRAADYYRGLELRKPEMKAWFDNWNHRAAWLPPSEPAGQEAATSI
jgi:lysozyme family protein